MFSLERAMGGNSNVAFLGNVPENGNERRGNYGYGLSANRRIWRIWISD